MEKPTLFISDDLPEEEKQILGCSQKILDLLVFYKTKQEAGTLTLDDLDELRESASAIADELPVSNEPVEGFPPQTSDMAELEAYAQRRGEEDLKLLEESGGPVYKIESFEQLKKLSTLPPQTLATQILAAAAKKREQEEGTQQADPPAESQEIKVTKEFRLDLVMENLETIHDLLVSAKLNLFSLQSDWQEVEPFEKQLRLNAKAFKGNNQENIDLLHSILNGEEKDEDLAEYKPEAALILASIATERGGELETLVELWEAEEKLAPSILQAFKYANNSFLNKWLQNTLKGCSPTIQAGFIEALEFHRLIAGEQWDHLLANGELEVSEKLMRAYLNTGIRVSRENGARLLQDPAADYAEEALFSALISGHDKETLFACRKRIMEKTDKVIRLPLYLACAGGPIDLNVLLHCLPAAKARWAVVAGLGILGLPQGVPALIDLIEDSITDKECWDRQCHLLDSLNLITGANLPLLFPEIKEGPEGKEYEVKVEIAWKEQWYSWWIDHQHRFESGVRYRRGQRFTLESCLDEMAYPRGNYWSRQYSYYELQIRTGQHIAPFFADWDVREQLQSIDQWRHWWQEGQYQYRFSQWYLHGKDLTQF